MSKCNTSWRETFAISWRAIRLWHQLAPKLVWAITISLAVEAISPYVTIWFSAQIIGELAGSRNPNRLWLLVLLTVRRQTDFALRLTRLQQQL